MKDTGTRRLVPPVDRALLLAALAALLAALVMELDRPALAAEAMQFFRPFAGLGALALLVLVFLRWGTFRAGASSSPRELRTAIAATLLAVALTVRPLLVPDWPEARDDKGGEVTIRLVSANLLSVNRDTSGLLALLADTNPDILAVQEAPFWWRDLMLDLPGYPHVVGYAPDGSGTVAIASRWPLEAIVIPSPGVAHREVGGGEPAAARLVMPDGRAIDVVSLHAPTPRLPGGLEARTRYLETLSEFLRVRRRANVPLIVVGDWNTPVWSRDLARVLRSNGLGVCPLGGLPPPTRLVGGSRRLGSPIDHIAVSPELGVVRCDLGADIASDHLPLMVELSLQTP